MNERLEVLLARVRRAAFWCLHCTFFLLSIFVILAPRELLLSLRVYVWSWVLALPPVWWLGGFIRCLYRGGE